MHALEGAYMTSGVSAVAALFLSVLSMSGLICIHLRVIAQRSGTAGTPCMHLRVLTGPMALVLLERRSEQFDHRRWSACLRTLHGEASKEYWRLRMLDGKFRREMKRSARMWRMRKGSRGKAQACRKAQDGVISMCGRASV